MINKLNMLNRTSTWIRVALARFIRFIRDREPIVLLGVLAVVLATWAFIEITDEVLEGSTGNFDRWAILHLRQVDNPALPIGPHWLAEAGRDITGLGGVVVLTLCIVASAGFLAIYRAYRTMVNLIVATTSGIAVSLLLKSFFARPRPDIVPHLSDVYTTSFPSGHAMMSAVVYLTLGVIIAPVLKNFWLRFYVMSVAILLTGLVGASRVFMGVHYPTDVFAGWAAGSTWAIMCWLATRLVFTPKIAPVVIRKGSQTF